MRKNLIALLAIFSLLIGLTACAGSTSAEADNTGGSQTEACSVNMTSGSDMSSMEGDKLTVKRVHVDMESISFSGQATLPDGTLLLTQLFAEEQPEAWWPSSENVEVKSGQWNISVSLGENGAPPTLSTSTSYSLKIWEQEAPSDVAWFRFDLSGPPPPSDLENR